MFEKIKAFLFENTTARQTVAKNTVWLSISNFGGRIIKAFIVIYAARVLGAAGYGVFSYAVTLAGFFTIFVDPGINAVLIRDVSKADEKGRAVLFSTTFVMKFCVIAASALIVLFVAPLFSTLPGAVVLLPLVAMIIIFDSTREFFSSLLRAKEKMEWDAGIFILANLSVVIAGFLFLHIAATPKSFVWAYVVGTAVGALAATYALRGYLNKIFSNFSSKLVLPIIRSAWPFAITGALGILLTNTDILIISWMRSASDVGIYSAAIRIVQIFYLVPVIFQFSTLPILSRLAKQDNQKFRTILERTIGLTFLAAIPLVFGGAILGTQVMALVFGNAYRLGGTSLTILMITMLFDYPAMIISSAIFAYDHQKSLIISSVIGGVLNVVLDILLIPSFGIVGSAVATLIAQGASGWYLWHTMKKINYFEVLPRLKRIAASGIIMAIATTLLFFGGANVLVNIIISAFIYFFALKLFKEPLLKEALATLPIFRKSESAAI